MRKLLLVASAGAALLVAGCATSGGYAGGAGFGYDYYGPSDVWYDGYYGPYSDGYWGDGGVFFYRDHDGHFRRDEGGHFRGHAFTGGHHFDASHHRH
jgi:hypothetical protein